MSEDHNTDNRSEVDRILSEHPPAERSSAIRLERLLGQLAPLRSLGDFQYKWSLEILRKIVVPVFGKRAVPPNYHTPPYLTAKPEIKYHKLNPRDKFLILGKNSIKYYK